MMNDSFFAFFCTFWMMILTPMASTQPVPMLQLNPSQCQAALSQCPGLGSGTGDEHVDFQIAMFKLQYEERLKQLRNYFDHAIQEIIKDPSASLTVTLCTFLPSEFIHASATATTTIPVTTSTVAATTKGAATDASPTASEVAPSTGKTVTDNLGSTVLTPGTTTMTSLRMWPWPMITEVHTTFTKQSVFTKTAEPEGTIIAEPGTTENYGSMTMKDSTTTENVDFVNSEEAEPTTEGFGTTRFKLYTSDTVDFETSKANGLGTTKEHETTDRVDFQITEKADLGTSERIQSGTTEGNENVTSATGTTNAPLSITSHDAKSKNTENSEVPKEKETTTTTETPKVTKELTDKPLTEQPSTGKPKDVPDSTTASEFTEEPKTKVNIETTELPGPSEKYSFTDEGQTSEQSYTTARPVNKTASLESFQSSATHMSVSAQPGATASSPSTKSTTMMTAGTFTPRPATTTHEDRCTVSEWSEWSAPYGFGRQERRREIMGYGDVCPETDRLVEYREMLVSVDEAGNNLFENITQVGNNFYTDFLRSVTSPRDILLIIDASGSIGQGALDARKRGVHNLIDLFCGGFGSSLSNNRMGIIKYSYMASGLIQLGDDQSASVLKDLAGDIGPMYTNTCTGNALQVAYSMFLEQFGARPLSSTPHDTLLITDGKSDCGEDLRPISRQLQSRSNVTVLAIGLGNDLAAKEELEGVVTDEDPRRIFPVADYKDLDELMDMLRKRQDEAKDC